MSRLTLTPAARQEKESTSISRRFEYCFSCYQSAEQVSVSLCEVETGTVRRTYSCTAGSVSSRGDGKAVNIALLGSTYLFCAPRAVPFIYVWNLARRRGFSTSGVHYCCSWSYFLDGHASNNRLNILKEQLQLKISCCGLLNALACSPDENYCAGSIEEKIYIWQVCSGHLLAIARQHYQTVNVLKYTDDGTYLLSGGADARVLVWKFSSVLSDAYTEGGNLIPFVSSTNATTGSHSSLTKHVWSDHSLSVTDIHCGSGGPRCRVATASLDQTCKLYELASGQLLCSFLLSFGLTAVTMDLGEHWLFVGGTNGSIVQINLFTQHHSHGQHLSGEHDRSSLLFNGHSKPITGVAVGRLSHSLISSSEEDSVKVWDIASRQVLRTVKLKGPVHNMFLTAYDLSSHLQQVHGQAPQQKLLSIQPFHKQLYFSSSLKESNKQKGMQVTTMAPITIKTCDPLCDLCLRVEYTCLYSPPAAMSMHAKNELQLTIQTLRQEISEVKDVHKRLYDFLIDSVADIK